jgi:hypothetical protein
MPALKQTKIIPESRLSRVSAAPPRQSPLSRKGSAETGHPGDPAALNSRVDEAEVMGLSQISFDPSCTGNGFARQMNQISLVPHRSLFARVTTKSSCDHIKLEL